MSNIDKINVGGVLYDIGGMANANLAPIEPTSTASQDYNVDRLLVYNGQLYKVIQAISENDTLVIDTNIEATNIDEVLNESTQLVSWSTGTDEEIGAMIDAYYNGDITLEEIQSVWSVGDSRTISLSAMSATGVGESHRAQNVEIQILDFDHDTLTTSVNGKTKSLITVDLKNCLRDATVSDTDGANNTENGYMNSTTTNVGGWTSCARRTWCNNVFFPALPIYLKNRVKAVNKKSCNDPQDLSIVTTNSDKIFIGASRELSGTAGSSEEGEIYALYSQSTSNSYKLPRHDSSSVTSRYWTRTVHPTTTNQFQYMTQAGAISHTTATSPYGMYVMFCL